MNAPALMENPSRFQAVKQDLGFLGLSIAIQLVIGTFFGHLYDTRISMATGYLVGTGQNPYIAQDLSSVFHNLAFQNITTVGYPPPWPLMTGLIYRAISTLTANFLAYNLALKLPIILANIGLAYLVAATIKKIDPSAKNARQAWKFMLLNPFLLCVTAAWGQFDSIVALLALSSLVLLESGKVKTSTLLLALAIAFKPIALPLVLIPLLHLNQKGFRQIMTYYGLLLVCGLAFCVLPFLIFRWDPSPIFQNRNAHFIIGGGMSLLTFLELTRNTYLIPSGWQFLGMLWVPALAISAFFINRRATGLKNLLLKSTALVMVFFLTRTWLSEPNIVLVLPFILILTSVCEFKPIELVAVWTLPLVFSFFNTGLAQLFFPSMPAVMAQLIAWQEAFRPLRLIARILAVVPWQIVGWTIVYQSVKKLSAFHNNEALMT